MNGIIIINNGIPKIKKQNIKHRLIYWNAKDW